MALQPGAHIGPYEIIAALGAGGMGEVYLARDRRLDRTAALKILPADVAENPDRLERFLREAKAASALNHPNVATIYDVGESDGIRFIAMEYVEGQSLSMRISGHPLAVPEIVSTGIQIADALSAAHAKGIVHRDIKPANVMITHGEHVKVLDFGLAKIGNSERDMSTTVAGSKGTVAGIVMGTVQYMSPEQVLGRSLDQRSDIFSLGVVLYEMATGRLPFAGLTSTETMDSVLHAEPDAIARLNHAVPPELERIVRKCLEKDRERRYPSARDLVVDLKNLQRDTSAGTTAAVRAVSSPLWWTRRAQMHAAAAAVVALAAGVGVWEWRQRPYRPQPAALEWYEKGRSAMYSMTYEAARKALEQAVAADANFALAHAGLARTYDEMDYSDRAKEVMLHALAVAQESRISAGDERRLRAQQFIVSREFERAAPLVEQLERDADGRDKAAAALESGWLAQQREDTQAAQAAYERALKLNPDYAAARLRLGFILGRRGGADDLALQMFTDAERLYGASSDYEGITETLLQRANLLNRRSRAAEAMPVIDKALDVARTVGNRYQEIRLMQLQGVAARNLGQTDRAGEMAQRAIDAAVAANMGNLASNGLLDLGSSYFARGGLAAAEPLFQRALDLARRGKVRRNEARAKASLGSLYEQDHRPAEARSLLEDVLPFYRQAGFRRELIQTMTLLAGVHEQLGEYEEGIRVSREAVAGTVQLRDSRSEALARERLGGNLLRSGSWPEALEEDRRAAALLGPGAQSGITRLECAQLSAWLGRRQDALQYLKDLEQVLEKTQNRRLSVVLHARQAEMAYADGRLNEALVLTMRGLSTPGHDEQADEDLSLYRALILIRTGRSIEGAGLAASLVQKLEHAKLVGNAASARVAIAEAWIASGHRATALPILGEALSFFESRRIVETAWRVHALIAQASEDVLETEAHRLKSGAALAQLKARWPAGSIDDYLRRPEIKRLSAGLGS